MDEQPRFPPDVAGQKAWAKELLRAACDLVDRINEGYDAPIDERKLRVNGIRFAYRRARELGFESELDVLMLARGIHIKAEHKEW